MPELQSSTVDKFPKWKTEKWSSWTRGRRSALSRIIPARKTTPSWATRAEDAGTEEFGVVTSPSVYVSWTLHWCQYLPYLRPKLYEILRRHYCKHVSGVSAVDWCPEPTQINGGAVTTNGKRVGSTATYSCLNGFILFGDNVSMSSADILTWPSIVTLSYGLETIFINKLSDPFNCITCNLHYIYLLLVLKVLILKPLQKSQRQRPLEAHAEVDDTWKVHYQNFSF